MIVSDTNFAGVKLLEPPRFGDARGFFSEIYNQGRFAEAGIPTVFVQDNHSLSRPTGTVRGLHFQVEPFAQAKLIRVARGRIFDVVVDLRRASPTFGRHLAVELDAANGRQLFVPAGFAHGFCTLEPDTEITYKVSAYYSREHDRCLYWADPALEIEWPVDPDAATVSEKDATAPRLADLGSVFD